MQQLPMKWMLLAWLSVTGKMEACDVETSVAVVKKKMMMRVYR